MNTHDKLKLAAELGVELPHYTNTDNPIDFPVRGADRTKELARKAGLIAPYGSDREGLADFDWREFTKLIIGDATECVRDVLREEGSTLSYEDCDKIQQRIKEYFGVKK